MKNNRIKDYGKINGDRKKNKRSWGRKNVRARGYRSKRFRELSADGHDELNYVLMARITAVAILPPLRPARPVRLHRCHRRVNTVRRPATS